MEKIETDILVIGGSANGSQAARIATKNETNVIVIEEHKEIGYPEHCSGLFSYEGLKKINSFPPENTILNEKILGAHIYSPSGKKLTVKKPIPHALVVDRAKFDKYLAETAIKQGATYFLNTKAIEIERKTDKWIVKAVTKKDNEKVEFIAKIIIDAEGQRATIAKKAGFLKYFKNRKIINAAQFYYDNLDNIDPEMVELFQTSKYAKDFFAWIIPINKDSAKIGLGTSEKYAAKKLEKFIKENPIIREKTKNANIFRKTAGRIPISGPIKKTYSKGLLLTGDVAGQTKPTTGGGVILGGIAAQIAGKVAAEAIIKNDTSEKFLKKYQKLWKKEIGTNLVLMKWVRNYLNNLSDQKVDYLFEKLTKKSIKEKIEKIGHVDDQNKIIVSMLLETSLYPFYIKTTPQLVKSIIL